MNPLDPLNLLNKKNKDGLNKITLRNYVQLVARNLLKDLPAISNNEISSGRLMAHLEIRNSLMVVLGSDDYTRIIKGHYNKLSKITENTYRQKIIKTSNTDKETFNYVLKQLSSHAIMFSNNALKEGNESDILLSQGLLSEYFLLIKSLISVVPKGMSSRIKVALERAENT
jgi:hypothetical protein